MRRASARLTGVLGALALVTGAASASASDASVCADAAEHAQQLRRTESLKAARAELVTCARPVCPGLVKKDCAAWLADLDKAMPTIVFRVEGPNGEAVPDAVLKLDQSPIAADAAAIAVDPGAHVVRVERPDQPPYEEPLAARAGEKDRVVVIHLPAPGPATATATNDGAMTAPTPRPLVGWILGGAGAAALVVTTGLWIAGVTSESHLRSTCGVTMSCSPAAVDSSHGKLVAGDVIGAFGGAAVIVGGSLLLFYKPSPKAAVTVAPTPGGAALGATVRF